jgi:hypothetical protein
LLFFFNYQKYLNVGTEHWDYMYLCVTCLS